MIHWNSLDAVCWNASPKAQVISSGDTRNPDISRHKSKGQNFIWQHSDSSWLDLNSATRGLIQYEIRVFHPYNVNPLRPIYTHVVHVKNCGTTGPNRTVRKCVRSGQNQRHFNTSLDETFVTRLSNSCDKATRFDQDVQRCWCSFSASTHIDTRTPTPQSGPSWLFTPSDGCSRLW